MRGMRRGFLFVKKIEEVASLHCLGTCLHEVFSPRKKEAENSLAIRN